MITSYDIEWKDQIAELKNKKSSLKNSWKLFTDFYNQKTGKNVAALEKDFKYITFIAKINGSYLLIFIIKRQERMLLH